MGCLIQPEELAQSLILSYEWNRQPHNDIVAVAVPSLLLAHLSQLKLISLGQLVHLGHLASFQVMQQQVGPLLIHLIFLAKVKHKLTCHVEGKPHAHEVLYEVVLGIYHYSLREWLWNS